MATTNAPSQRHAAHFLDNSDILGSPPNDAILSALIAEGYNVDVYAPGPMGPGDMPGLSTFSNSVQYTRGWLARNLFASRWNRYTHFSATAEDALVAAAMLAKVRRRPFLASVDEIKAGSYRGDRSESWKGLARWSIRQAYHALVNDESRIEVLRSYSGRKGPVDIYPGCFRRPPDAADIAHLRQKWAVAEGQIVIGVSGGFNETGAADWVLDALGRGDEYFLVVQALNARPFERLLLERVANRERMYLEPSRLEWREAWAQSTAFDVGIAIYHNDAPQFQNMGISSNRLCMFLAMGVPVIASRQPSFQFLEDFGCGFMVSSFDEFTRALRSVRDNGRALRRNALRAAEQYIAAPRRYESLRRAIASNGS